MIYYNQRGDILSSIKDVARVAGISVTTVSRVINNRGYISEKTRKKVEDAMRELDYQPNQIAIALSKKQSYIIGVIVPDSSHPFFSELLKYIELYVKDKNYKILFVNSLDDKDTEMHCISMLKQNRVDGIIMCSHTLDIDTYKKLKLPVVSFDRIISDSIPYVASDNFNGGLQATEHLIKLGCKSLLHIAGPSQIECLSNRRGDGFKIACINNNIDYKIMECDEDVLTFDYYMNFVEEKVAPIIDTLDGVFCSNDILAYALYVYCTRNNISVPGDLKIIGYDNTMFTRMLQTPRLSTVNQPVESIGKTLTKSIISLIEEPEYEVTNITLDVKLVKGETT